MSPTKTNGFELLTAELQDKLEPIPEQKVRGSSNLRKKRLTINKFQEMKINEAVFKRVMIQNGKYEKDRATNKDNRMKAIVNYKFD